MSADLRRLLELKARSDLVTFIHRSFQTVVPGQRFFHSWHVEAMAWHLERCRRGRSAG